MPPIVIKTSYLSLAKYVSNPVSISCAPVSWFKNYDIKFFRKLAPPKDIVMLYKDGHISKDEYTAIYNDKVLIQWHNGKDLVDELVSTFGNIITLLCWEHPNEFCHRHIVAKFISKSSDITVNEFDQNSPILENEYEAWRTENKRE